MWTDVERKNEAREGRLLPAIPGTEYLAGRAETGRRNPGERSLWADAAPAIPAPLTYRVLVES